MHVFTSLTRSSRIFLGAVLVILIYSIARVVGPEVAGVGQDPSDPRPQSTAQGRPSALSPQLPLSEATATSVPDPPTLMPMPTPTPAPRAYKVALQAGHYKMNELPPALAPISKQLGTYGGGRNEPQLTFDMAQRTAKLLQDQGVQVDVLPATVPTGYTADAFVSLHADGATSKDRRGYKVSTRYESMVAVQDALLVEALTEEYNAATGLPQDYRIGDDMRDYYAFTPLRPNYRVSLYTPAAIIEMGFMTNAADRELLFDAPDRAAQGLANGIIRFLETAYGRPATSRTYGYGDGVVDDRLNLTAPGFPTPSPEVYANRQSGDWQILLMGKPRINIYRSEGGGGGVLTQLPRGQFYRSTLRVGDFYRITLPDGREGWVHRNSTVIQMK